MRLRHPEQAPSPHIDYLESVLGYGIPEFVSFQMLQVDLHLRYVVGNLIHLLTSYNRLIFQESCEILAHRGKEVNVWEEYSW
jgi:hypothetical protein